MPPPISALPLIGLRTVFSTPIDIDFDNDTTLTTVGLASDIAPNEQQHLRYWVLVNMANDGDMKMKLSAPAGVIYFKASVNLFDPVNDASHCVRLNAPAELFTFSFTDAGDYWIDVEATIAGGAIGGQCDLTFAQNTASNKTLTIQKGSVLQVVKLLNAVQT